MRRLLTALSLFTGCAFAQDWSATPRKHWTDKAEFDIANAAATETDPATRLLYLNTWTRNYRYTEFIDERGDMALSTYQQLHEARLAFDGAQKILSNRPNNFRALTAMVSEVTAIRPAPTLTDLDKAEKAANYLLNSADTVFAAANKPWDMTDAEWARAKDQITPFVQQALTAIRGLR